jgi:DNA-binding PucR family transcriptional regulator
VFGRVGHLGIVVSGGSDDADPTPEIAQVLEGDLSRGNRVLVAIGPPREHLSGVRESFEAAVAVIEAGRALGTGGLLAAGKTAVPRLVAAARSAGLEVTTVLNPVLSVDPVEAEELSRALGAYVRNACSVQRAATALHVHRNTMRRRLQRAQELLAFSIAERWLEVELALIALESSDLTAAASAR